MDPQQLENGTPAYPAHLNTFAIPNDPDLKRVYNVYKPSIEVLQLPSQQGRTIFPEVFVENSRLDTLKNLCTAVLARSYGPHPLPLVAQNPLLLKIHYDALDIELPLAQCYEIEEERFWKRLVLAKHKDKTLAIKENVNWKNLGVSLKYVELVEQCPVEYWPEEEMKELALNVKEFVKEMHIKHLQSLRDQSFEKKFQTDSESTTSEDDTSSSRTTTDVNESVLSRSVDNEATDEDIREAKAQRQKEREMLRVAKQKAREIKEAKRKRRQAKRAAKEKNPEPKPIKKIPKNVFDMKVSEDSEDNEDDRIVDKRNKALLLSHINKYNYPANDCHHVDLKFLQYFTNLESFSIEFLGPVQNHNFHKRHWNFSLQDIQNLSIGLSHLSQLKIFRLRNSKMDAEKLRTVCGSLGLLPCLETIDFGWDQLKDDCASAFEELFKMTTSLRSLELESNFFCEQVLQTIGKALQQYTAKELSYLGLARNPITDKALHGLVSAIIGTKHVEHLNIRAIKFLTDEGLCCCLAKELLMKHPPLIKLDICAIRISPPAADEIVKSLQKNKKILEIYCVGCELDDETEIDINVIMKRNKFIADNYYVGNPSVTVEEVTKWQNRSRNPIFLKVLAERENRKQCLQNRPQESFPISSPDISQDSFSLDMKMQMYDDKEEENSSLQKLISPKASKHFIYAPNDFNEQQFLENVYQPGPQERYYYFKTYKQKYSIKENEKN